jgi:hypothetical protein
MNKSGRASFRAAAPATQNIQVKKIQSEWEPMDETRYCDQTGWRRNIECRAATGAVHHTQKLAKRGVR